MQIHCNLDTMHVYASGGGRGNHGVASLGRVVSAAPPPSPFYWFLRYRKLRNSFKITVIAAAGGHVADRTYLELLCIRSAKAIAIG